MNKRNSWLSFIIILILLLIIYVPIIYSVLIAFTPKTELFKNFIPRKLTLIAFFNVLTNYELMRTYLNSIIVDYVQLQFP